MLVNLPNDILKDEVCKYLDIVNLGKLIQTNSSPIWREAFDAFQGIMRKNLFGAKDGGGKWCWIHPPVEQCFDVCEKSHGALVRFMTRIGQHSVYCAYDSFRELDPDKHCTYLIYDINLRIRWVGAGMNAVGCMLYGYELEWDAKHPIYDSDSSEEDSSEGEEMD